MVERISETDHRSMINEKISYLVGRFRICCAELLPDVCCGGMDKSAGSNAGTY